MLGDLRVGAREQQAPVGDLAAARPDLLAVDDEVVALVHGGGLERGQVAAGVGLGVELAPQLLGREDLLEIALLLRVGAVDDDGRPDDADAQAVGRRRRVGLRHLVGHDRLLHRPRARRRRTPWASPCRGSPPRRACGARRADPRACGSPSSAGSARARSAPACGRRCPRGCSSGPWVRPPLRAYRLGARAAVKCPVSSTARALGQPDRRRGVLQGIAGLTVHMNIAI